MRRIVTSTSVSNVEPYLTVVVALTFGVLGTLDVVSVAVTGGATLATLALVAVGSLAARRQVAELDRSVHALEATLHSRSDHASAADRYLSTSMIDAELHLADASDVRLVGVTLSRTVRTRLAELDRLLRNGGRLRVAILNPTGEAPAEAARRSSIGAEGLLFKHRIQPTLDLLARIADDSDAVEVRLLDFVPAYGMTMVNPTSPGGRIWVDLYSHRPAAREPMLSLHAGTDGRWYQHFLAEFDAIWAAGHPVNCRRASGSG